MRFLCATLAAAILGLGFKAMAEMTDGIEVVVHDSIITSMEVEDATTPVADELRRQYHDQPDVFEKKINDALKENREQLLDRQLILHDFDTAGYNLPESIIDEQLQEYIKSRYGDRVTLTKTLQQQGITFEKFRKQFRERFIIEQMRYKNISSEIIISPHKVETYYVEHKDSFKVEDQVKLRMIVLSTPPGGDSARTRELANEVLAKLNEGASFSDMAAIHSQGAQRYQEGEWVEKSVLRKELADSAFSLKPGEKSGVIETPEACYILLVEDKRESHVKALGEVRDEIEKILLAQERERLQKQWIARLRQKTFVRYF